MSVLRSRTSTNTPRKVRASFKTAWTGMFGHVWTSACT
ncbi:unnamed protein product [Chondrus crispus]|uniref:Uncharacterized protein n=1 Tax=Chondrus crispus TaxID=2769 RepID=R7QT61_CHOCR|nr:unnamed protein product [Chondrus crispus]CDF40908.1 unnamed protein product [Chondrus crispus]|eukprot:XP_005711202.1 unnamed protein product [Chondrus crispus]